jgi:hypothetical protein
MSLLTRMCGILCNVMSATPGSFYLGRMAFGRFRNDMSLQERASKVNICLNHTGLVSNESEHVYRQSALVKGKNTRLVGPRYDLALMGALTGQVNVSIKKWYICVEEGAVIPPRVCGAAWRSPCDICGAAWRVLICPVMSIV